MPLKVMTIIGTRPEIIKLSRVIAELDKFTRHILVHTGQNYDYELNEIFFRDLGVRKPDYFLKAAGRTPMETIGQVIARSDELFAREKPDALLLYGDTNSALAVIAAKRRQIPIFHMEAGNRAFDQRVPEDVNRKIVDHLSDINLPLTEHARRYLLAEGLRPETVIKTGAPMKEIFAHHWPQIKNSKVLEKLGLKKNEYFIVSAHREENIEIEANFRRLMACLKALARRYDKPIIVSTHPRTRKKLEKLHLTRLHRQIRFLKPLGFFDYVALELDSRCVLSDSGTITEESSILNFPAVMIRETHERPEGMDEGAIIMSGLEPKRVLEAVRVTLAQRKSSLPFRLPADYDTENVSGKMVRIILSYTDYVNRTVWYK